MHDEVPHVFGAEDEVCDAEVGFAMPAVPAAVVVVAVVVGVVAVADAPGRHHFHRILFLQAATAHQVGVP